MINNDLLIDLGPDVVVATSMYNLDLSNVKYLLQTHPHHDHFDANHLVTRMDEYKGVGTENLNINASESTLKRMSEMINDIENFGSDLFDSNVQKRLKISIHAVRPFEKFTIGGYKIVGIPANHDNKFQSMLYSITSSGKSIFYGTDTDSLSKDTWRHLSKLNIKFDVVVLDHTYGFGVDGGGHLNGDKFVEHKNKFVKNELIKDNARFYATHISHEGNGVHDEMSRLANKYEYNIAYDGLKVEV